ncbi:uncharacterized protein PITG_22617 [Phytophthora infestans T30-4]|uniref:Tc1-like transposase DDE domain-containing protein n=1 Tax=Phytophthora infestans (strain T30-4) TaxID=403677 RepID=D0RMM4_PHYIT|nr:uncharacterized protein PITG_22617 [Phytophthora infestans T30-4]EEY64950.1 conserved hypothetical protein [Phytophthora infestans T30-4]|eukprot:XP_002909706.1 conserved hypothetical protein [Phytophthora infestans T30-4]
MKSHLTIEVLRKRGYALRGQIRGKLQRIPRVSMLAFIGVNGVIDYYDSRAGARPYPRSNSLWILYGASIHCHPEIAHFLRSIGIVPIFLPAYCPFFNPIEYLFGYVKKAFQRHYEDSTDNNLVPVVAGRWRASSIS